MTNKFITLAEASEKEGWNEVKLLRMGSEGEINFFYRFSLINTELGEINIAPTGRNSIPWNNQDKDYATPLPLDAEKHISNENFSAVNGPGANKIIILKLSPSMVLNVLNDVSITITYGWLPNDTAFKVVKPEKGLPIKKDGMLLQITSLLFIEQKRQSAEQKQIQASLQESAPKQTELIEFQSLQNRLNGKTVGDILRLGLQGELRFFVILKYVSISWGTMFNECFDPKHWLDIEEATPFEVSDFSTKELLECREDPKSILNVQVIYPEAICNLDSIIDTTSTTKYQSQIKTNTDLWPELQEKLRVNEKTHLENQRKRTIDDLWIPEEDVKKYLPNLPNLQKEPDLSDLTEKIARIENNLTPLAEKGSKFSGNKRGRGPFKDLMYRIYEVEIQKTEKVTAKRLWGKIPTGKDPGTGLIVQEKIADGNLSEWKIEWLHPKGKDKNMSMSTFQDNFTQIKKEYSKNS